MNKPDVLHWYIVVGVISLLILPATGMTGLYLWFSPKLHTLAIALIEVAIIAAFVLSICLGKATVLTLNKLSGRSE